MNASRSSLVHAGSAFTLALAAGALLVAGCSSDNSQPTNEPPPVGEDAGIHHGAGGSAGSSSAGGQSSLDGGPGGSGTGAAGTVDGGKGGSDGGEAPSTGGHSATGGSGATDSGTETCDRSKTGSHPKACFPCAPTKNSEYLNHCTDSDCSPFDNAARLGAANWNDGKLTPLP